MLKKYDAFTDDNSYAAPTGDGNRLKISTADGKEYEFLLKDISQVDYYMQGDADNADADAIRINHIGADAPLESEVIHVCRRHKKFPKDLHAVEKGCIFAPSKDKAKHYLIN